MKDAPELSITDFTRIATLNKNSVSKIDVYIASLKNTNKLYTINRFVLNRSSKAIFKDFFFLSHSKNRPKNFLHLLVDSKNFYLVFSYQHHRVFNDVFGEEKNTYDYIQRCSIIKKILTALSKIESLPSPALACCTEVSNICITDNNDIEFYYNFENYFQYYDKYNGSKSKIYKNISYIISTLLKKELKKNKIPFMGFYNKPYKMILQKCDTALYKNIPELVVEFTKAEKICDVQDVTSAASKYLSAKKKLLQKYITGGLVILITAVVVYMFYPLFVDKNAPSSLASKIGTLVYNENIYTPEFFHVGDPVSDPPPPFDYTSISIPANDDDILYEEYIVQYGDTFKSICQQYYNNENLVNAVVSFNSLNASDTLNAGFILKLPSPSVIEKIVIEKESKNSRATSSNSSELDFIF